MWRSTCWLGIRHADGQQGQYLQVPEVWQSVQCVHHVCCVLPAAAGGDQELQV
jgi:hypothetical protein